MTKTEDAPATSRPPISAAIICFNEERNIERCLEAVSWCEQIVVVDSGSTDRTLSLVGRFPAEACVRKFDTYINQKNFALDRCRHDWVLSVDADEVITPALAEEIRRLPFDAPGYQLLRRTYLGDRQIRRGHWARDYQVRLFRRWRGRWGGSNPHERVVLNGAARRLRNPMLHYSFRNRQEFLDRNRKYTEMLADYLARQGRKTYPGEAMLHAVGNFVKGYLLRRGFLDGEAGLFLAYHYSRLSYLKYSLLAQRRRQAPDAPLATRRAA
jgi:glycosyltransferase involved in cell wall biosynthesis